MTFEEWCEQEGYHPAEIDHGAELWAAATAAERDRCEARCRVVMDYHSAKADREREVDAADRSIVEDISFREGEACGAEDCIEAIHDDEWPGA